VNVESDAPTRTELLAEVERLRVEVTRLRRSAARLEEVDQLVAIPLRDPHSKVGAALETVIPVTDRRAIEQELRRNQQELTAILDSMSELVVYQDLGNRVLRANRAAGVSVGEPPQALAGRLCHEIWHHRSEPCEGCAVIEARESGSYRQREIRDPFGRVFLIKGNPVRNESGEVVGIVEVAENITERVRAQEERLSLERQLQHAQKLESLGVLAGGIAHDFNNLLTGVLGNADLALAKLPASSPVRAELTSIEEAAERAAELSSLMLAYSGRGKFSIGPVDLSTVVRGLGTLVEASFSKKAVLSYHLASDLPAVNGDATQLQQVVMNLLTNAAEAIGEAAGTISVTTRAVTCSRELLHATYVDDGLPAGSYVSLEVRDSGCGMDAETRAKIFDPFFTTKFAGRGLGLAALLGIVRGHRGAIRVDSERGKGSTFTLFLPAVEGAQVAAAAVAPASAPPLGAETVLLVEDDAGVREVAERMLSTLGYRILVARDGAEGVESFRDGLDRVDLVLLDLTMPRMGGEEALVEIRQLRPDARVVLCSGYGEEAATERVARAGLAGFLHKPYTLAKLAEALAVARGAAAPAAPADSSAEREAEERPSTPT
jgi:two-component system cell cycle sensor histidine kinase/response regulator CckA